jgi:hypothetical protein
MFPSHLIAVYFCADDGWQKVAVVARIYELCFIVSGIYFGRVRKKKL